jgi:hypothetical protein
VLVEIHEPQRAAHDLRMTIGVTDPAKMVFIEDARDARKACECRQDCNVLIGPRKPIEVVGLKSHTRARDNANCYLTENGIRGAAFALFPMKSQEIIRRYAPATLLSRQKRAARE